MKKWLYFLTGLFVVGALGTDSSAGKDVGKLQPVQVVCLSYADDKVRIWTDTGDAGSGPDLMAAVGDMSAAAASEVFLETADYLLVSRDCLALLQDAAGVLRPSCSVCLMDGQPDMERVGQYLTLHIPQITLMEYRAGEQSLQTLKTTDGRMTLVS